MEINNATVDLGCSVDLSIIGTSGRECNDGPDITIIKSEYLSNRSASTCPKDQRKTSIELVIIHIHISLFVALAIKVMFQLDVSPALHHGALLHLFESQLS